MRLEQLCNLFPGSDGVVGPERWVDDVFRGVLDDWNCILLLRSLIASSHMAQGPGPLRAGVVERNSLLESFAECHWVFWDFLGFFGVWASPFMIGFRPILMPDALFCCFCSSRCRLGPWAHPDEPLPGCPPAASCCSSTGSGSY